MDVVECGVLDHLIKVQGWWRSSAYQHYIELSPAVVLSITAPWPASS